MDNARSVFSCQVLVFLFIPERESIPTIMQSVSQYFVYSPCIGSIRVDCSLASMLVHSNVDPVRNIGSLTAFVVPIFLHESTGLPDRFEYQKLYAGL